MAEKTEQMSQNDHRWVVLNRNAVQIFMLELYELENNRVSSNVEKHIYNLLVGIVFSLWRGVFIAPENRNWGTVYPDAKSLLNTLIADNAATFMQEKTTRNWMSGFHMQNASYRLIEIGKFSENRVKIASLAKFYRGGRNKPKAFEIKRCLGRGL